MHYPHRDLCLHLVDKLNVHGKAKKNPPRCPHCYRPFTPTGYRRQCLGEDPTAQAPQQTERYVRDCL